MSKQREIGGARIVIRVDRSQIAPELAIAESQIKAFAARSGQAAVSSGSGGYAFAAPGAAQVSPSFSAPPVSSAAATPYAIAPAMPAAARPTAFASAMPSSAPSAAPSASPSFAAPAFNPGWTAAPYSTATANASMLSRAQAQFASASRYGSLVAPTPYNQEDSSVPRNDLDRIATARGQARGTGRSGLSGLAKGGLMVFTAHEGLGMLATGVSAARTAGDSEAYLQQYRRPDSAWHFADDSYVKSTAATRAKMSGAGELLHGVEGIRAADDARGVAALRSAEASPPDLADARRKFSVAVAELGEAEVAIARRLGALRGELAAFGGKASFGSITAIEAEVAAVEKAGRREIETARQAKALAEAELTAAARADAELEKLRSRYGHFLSDDAEPVAEAA